MARLIPWTDKHYLPGPQPVGGGLWCDPAPSLDSQRRKMFKRETDEQIATRWIREQNRANGDPRWCARSVNFSYLKPVTPVRQMTERQRKAALRAEAARLKGHRTVTVDGYVATVAPNPNAFEYNTHPEER